MSRFVSLPALIVLAACVMSSSADERKEKAPPGLKLTRLRITHGPAGPERRDDKVLPGEVLSLWFDIENLTVTDSGKALYAVTMELTRKSDKQSVFKLKPAELEAGNLKPGSVVPTTSTLTLATDAKAGEYTVTFTVKDRSTNKVTKATKTFTVLEPDFGFVRVSLVDAKGRPVPPVAVPGQDIQVRSSLVGFRTARNRPNLTLEVHILDAKDKPALAKPVQAAFTTEFKGRRDLITFTPIPLELKQAGKFKVLLKATEKLSGKSTEQSIYVVVRPR